MVEKLSQPLTHIHIEVDTANIIFYFFLQKGMIRFFYKTKIYNKLV